MVNFVSKENLTNMKVTLANDILSVAIDSHGAELRSIMNIRTRQEYLWQGDKQFWGRRSPVLFPIVGAVWNGEYRMDGKVYNLPQHGFARDMEFSVVDDTPEGEAWFALESDDETFEKYPRAFRLEIGYRLTGERIDVMWRVVNTGDRRMDFQIGAHPAFNYPEFNASDAIHGFFSIDGPERLSAQIIEEKGCIGNETATIVRDECGLVAITADTFRRDAVILADNQAHRVSLLDKKRSPLLTLLFRAPLVGLWSPRPDAPFVCIEPWWGRADSVGFTGEFASRAYAFAMEPGATFEAGYTIIIDNI